MRFRRPIVRFVVGSLFASLTFGLPPVPFAAAAGLSGEPSVPVSPVPHVDRPVTQPPLAGAPAAPVWPSAGSATADLSSGAMLTSSFSFGSALESQVSPGGLRVTVSTPAGGGASVEDNEQRMMRGLAPLPSATSDSGLTAATVTVLDQAMAARLGVKGVLLTLAPSGASSLSTSAPAGVTVDYSGFANAYGGGYSDRLRLVSLPACALTTPTVKECAIQTPVVGGRNDKATASVTATVDLASATSSSSSSSSAAPSTMDASGADSSGGAQVLAVTAGTSSDQGNWAATNLAQAASWQAGSSGGAFTYSVPFPVPPAPGGLTPKISFDYSSASADGLTKSTQTQASWIGEGWNYDPGFVERSYRPCNRDGEPASKEDLCWVTDSVDTIVLNGVSTRLFKDDASGVWKAEDDSAGWKVDHVTGANNGAYNGEAFTITTRDGTRYKFGSKPPASYGGVLNVPVYSNNSGEPCYSSQGYAYSVCVMPYRWNLDQVVDVNGNTIDYQWVAHQGTYGNNGGLSGPSLYDLYGHLVAIEYGHNPSAGVSQPSGRIEFTIGFRCFYGDCAHTTDPATWMDTPWDQYCAVEASSCAVHAPTFWNIYRLTEVASKVWTGTGWGSWDGIAWTTSPVDDWQTTQGFADPGDYVPPAGSDSSPSLWLMRWWRSGYSTPIEMGAVGLKNRVDWGCCDTFGNQVPPMVHWRVNQINTGVGETITIAYTGEDCAWNSLPTAVINNRRCYPQISSGVTSWWHKYVVTDVTDFDGLNPVGEQWHYDYAFTGANTDVIWKFDQAWHSVPEDRTWSRWAGYPTVTTTHRGADGSGPVQISESLFYRGLNLDKTLSGWGTRTGKVLDDWGTFDDSEWLAGQVARTYAWTGTPNGARDNWASVVRHHFTATQTGSFYMTANPTILANRVRETETLSGTRMAGLIDRWTQGLTTFEATYGLATKTQDLGDMSTAADDRCTDITYTTANTTAWIVGLPSQSITTNCAATPTKTDVLAAARSYYDQSATLGAMPTKGMGSKSTAIAAATAYPPATADYVQQSRAVYDPRGRVQDSFDALDRKTSTAYTPVLAGPITQVAVTGPMGAGWTTTTTLEPNRGQPTKVLDVNNKKTEATYDLATGRLLKVWKNNRATGLTADVEYAYQVNGTNWISTKTLGPDGQQILSYQLFDGRLRPRQTQAPSATGTGRALTYTFYNSLGQVTAQSTLYNSSPVDSTLVAPADKDVPTQQKYTYDSLGRKTAEQQWTGNGTTSSMLWQSIFGYDGDKIFTVTPPAGGTATTTIKDARGQTTELWQHQAATPTGSYDKTIYGYDRLGQLTSVKDAGLNTWTYTYDLLGRKTSTVDPDAGTSSSTYDNAGQVTSTTDGRPQTLYYTYDNLGRKTTERTTSATGQIQADWVYDPTSFKGQLTSTSRYINGVATYTSRVDSYNDAYQPLSTTDLVPGFGTSGGTLTYTVTNAYKQNGAPDTQTLPIVGSLPAETITHTYQSATGLPDRLYSGSATYVDASTYLFDGLLSNATYGTATGNQLKVSATYDTATRRLATSAFSTKTSGTWANDRYKDTYSYDNAGNITSIAGTKDAAAEQEQCFTYDYLRRLTEAWTQLSGTCSAQRTGADPYRRQWLPNGVGYDNIGNRLQQIDKDPGGDTTWNYSIGGTTTCSTTAKPHQVRQITATGPKSGTPTRNFCYDTAGNTIKRTTDTGAVQDLHYDVEGHLKDVQQGSTTPASYVYDTSGRRLIGTEYNITTGKTTVTAYLPDGTELAKIEAAAPLGRRYYSTGAVRDAAGGLKWTINTNQVSGTFQIDPTTNAISTPRRFLPFGESRNAQPTGWIGTRSYVGGTQDTTTGLTHLGAREYDPSIGRFTSVDPLMDMNDPQQWNPYTYAGNTPVTSSDPTGLFRELPGVDGGGGASTIAPPRNGGGGGGGAITFGGLFRAAWGNKGLGDFIAKMIIAGTLTTLLAASSGYDEDPQNSRFARHEDGDRGRISFDPHLTSIGLGDGQWLWSDGSIRDRSGTFIYKQTPSNLTITAANPRDDEIYGARAAALANSTQPVVLRDPPPDGGERGKNTSDLTVGGVQWDVYSPETANIGRIASWMVGKRRQVWGGGIVLNLRNSSLRAADIDVEALLRRVNNAPTSESPPLCSIIVIE